RQDRPPRRPARPARPEDDARAQEDPRRDRLARGGRARPRPPLIENPSVMRGRTAGLSALLIGAIALAAAMYATERILFPPGLLMPLALLAGFVGVYIRERRGHPELDPGDEDDHRSLIGRTVLKFGCLLFAVAILTAVVFGLVEHLIRP